MKKGVSAILALFLMIGIGLVYAGTRNPVENDIIERIAAQCASMKSMKCDFRQVRTVPLMDDPQISSGEMLYRQPSSLKWIYKKPFIYSITIDNDNISVETDQGGTEMGSDASRMFRGLVGIVLGCMSGENLKDKRLFQTTVTEQDNEWVAVLVPQRREMKRLFSEIVMVFDPATSLLKRLDMKDQNGGSTAIEISNVSINGDYEAEW
ncbi:MAG: outer membrane lipoprotein carrier protein LolA [Bacteroidaceae bacterium]|nr:outer membrane lipoprotein carrier protein LolA [Bacteroidaceae bacterium]